MSLPWLASSVGVIAFVLVGCGSAERSSGSGASGAGGGACVVEPRPAATLPHVRANGDAARAVAKALDALLAAKTPPVAAAKKSYASAAIDCGDLQTGIGPSGFECSFALGVDGRPNVKIDVSPPSALAKDLFDALDGAGAKLCNDIAHGRFIHAQAFALDVGGEQLDFDDASTHALPPSPNVVVDGDAASAVLDAMAAADATECDPKRRLFFVCNTDSGSPGCGVETLRLDDVDGSELVYTCLPVGEPPPKQLSAADSAGFWKAILAAGAAAHYQPAHGTVAEATVVNASYFQLDGDKLGFTFTADDVTPPPPPAHP